MNKKENKLLTHNELNKAFDTYIDCWDKTREHFIKKWKKLKTRDEKITYLIILEIIIKKICGDKK